MVDRVVDRMVDRLGSWGRVWKWVGSPKIQPTHCSQSKAGCKLGRDGLQISQIPTNQPRRVLPAAHNPQPREPGAHKAPKSTLKSGRDKRQRSTTPATQAQRRAPASWTMAKGCLRLSSTKGVPYRVGMVGLSTSSQNKVSRRVFGCKGCAKTYW